MSDNLEQYLDRVFAPYEGVKSVAELKTDLLSDLQERFRELKAEGKDDETALAMTIDSIGDIEATVQEMANLSRSLERQVRIRLNAINVQKGDFAGVTAHHAEFSVSDMRGFDFSNADLTGSSFEVIDAREANFDGANLTDCNFSVTDLTDASFHKSILVRTTLNIAGEGAKFIDVRLIDVKFIKTDLRRTIFEGCIFSGVDFDVCDLRGTGFDRQTLTDVKFDKCTLNNVSFRGATLKNVSFTLPFSVTNKYYRAMRTVRFDGATMDKLTYATLKGLRVVDLSKVTVI